MDRSVLESDPHRVLEGMAIAALRGRGQPGLRLLPRRVPARRRAGCATAIRQAERAGLPRAPASSTRRSPSEIDVRLGAGAFVCGEETALIASIEGGRGTPRPAPAVPGRVRAVGQPDAHQQRRDLRQHRRRSSATAATGSPASAPRRARAPRSSPWPAGSSTPAWSRCRWAPRCARSSYDIGGGIVDGRAVQGGPDRRPVRRLHPGRVPRHAGRLRVAHRRRLDHGLGRHDRHGRHARCMVDVARYFMDFCREESCGKCVPCRVGHHRSSALLLDADHRAARRPLADLDQLERLADMVQQHQPVRPGPGRARTRSSARCATSATSTWPTSSTGPARPGVCPIADAGGGAA